jgi:hypothetical protein
MCRITDFKYTCDHHIQHVWSACRGQKKVDKDSNKPACQKIPSIYAKLATKCGSCNRADAEQKLRRDLTETRPKEQSTEEFESILSEQFLKLTTQIPTTNNWRPLPSPMYGRKPSQKRVHKRRKNSLLRNEFKPEDTCEPEPWEDKVVPMVYEAVEDGWNFPWTAETKSLADELAEDEERKKQEFGDEDEGFGDEGEDDGETEEDLDGGEEALGGENEGEGKEEKEESASGSPSEPPGTIEAEVNGSSVKVCYRFRNTKRGCKGQMRQWEMVEIWV